VTTFQRRVINPFLVPLENAYLDRWASREPRLFRAEVDAAIEAGIDWFEAVRDWEIDSLVALSVFVNERHDPRLTLVKPALERYRQQWCNPLLRVIDPDYDAGQDGVGRERIYRPSSARDDLMVRCVNADRDGESEELLRELWQYVDHGGYGTTHILLGCDLLRRFGKISKTVLDESIAKTIRPIVRAERRDRFRDLYAERAAFLLWQGYGDCVQPSWILRICRAQREDGGWYRRWRPWGAASEQHPVCLALAALLLYREQKFGSPAR